MCIEKNQTPLIACTYFQEQMSFGILKRELISPSSVNCLVGNSGFLEEEKNLNRYFASSETQFSRNVGLDL